MNNNNNEIVLGAVSTVEARDARGKIDYAVLPKLTEGQISIHPFKNKRADGALEVNGYAVYVQVGGKWRHINEVLLYKGFKTVAPAQTMEAAERTKANALKKWGVAVAVKERKPSKAERLLVALAEATGKTVDELKAIAKAEAEKAKAEKAKAAA